VSNNDKRLIISISDGSARTFDFNFSVAKIDSGLMKRIVQIGACIFGDEKDTGINTVARLCAVLKEPYLLGPNGQDDDPDDEDEEAENEEEAEDDEDLEDEEEFEEDDEDEAIDDEDDDDNDGFAGDENPDLDEDDETERFAQSIGLTTKNTGQVTDSKNRAAGTANNTKIDEPFTIVYAKNDDHEPIANLLSTLIKPLSSVEPEIQTTSEYEAALFEDELLGEAKDRRVVFLGNAAAAISDGPVWKYNQSGIKYGWKGKQAAFVIEKAQISKNAAIEELLKAFIKDFTAK
jgi:hypothetical protein